MAEASCSSRSTCSSVTSAKKRWVENVNVAEAIGAKLQADEPFDVTPDMIGDYNTWAAKRRGGSNVTAVPHPDLKPGRYRPSELPSDFVASKTPGMPKLLNADGVIAAVKIARSRAGFLGRPAFVCGWFIIF